MPKTEALQGLALINRLDDCKISENRYLEECALLTQKGYSSIQAQTIIIKKGSKDTVSKLLSLHDSLIEKKYTHTEITLLTKNGGKEVLQSVFDSTQLLLDLRYTRRDIFKLANHHGGEKNIAAVLTNNQRLLDLGFQNEHILKIAQYAAGALNINAVLLHYKALLALSLQPKDIAQIAGNRSGTHNIIAMIQYTQTLFDFKFTQEDILRMGGQSSGSRILEFVVKHVKIFQDLKYTSEQISTLSSSYQGYVQLKMIVDRTKNELKKEIKPVRKYSTISEMPKLLPTFTHGFFGSSQDNDNIMEDTEYPRVSELEPNLPNCAYEMDESEKLSPWTDADFDAYFPSTMKANPRSSFWSNKDTKEKFDMPESKRCKIMLSQG